MRRWLLTLAGHISETNKPTLIKFSALNVKVFKSRKHQFHWDQMIRVHFLSLCLARLLSKIRYTTHIPHPYIRPKMLCLWYHEIGLLWGFPKGWKSSGIPWGSPSLWDMAILLHKHEFLLWDIISTPIIISENPPSSDLSFFPSLQVHEVERSWHQWNE